MIELRTSKPVALDSPDHIHPWGSALDSNTNHRFNDRVFLLFGERQIQVLDLGCAGGGYVRSMLDDGHEAVGIEGSDHSARMRRAEWRSIPERLFTADVTAPFEVVQDGAPMRFDLITAWELLEHLLEPGIPTLCRNILAHLADGGLFIASINTGYHRGYHQTVKPRGWWLELFAQHSLDNHPEIIRWFQQQFVRGERFGVPNSFHVALSRRGDSKIPVLPRVPVGQQLFDLWHFSLPHRIIRELVIGRK